MLRLDSGARQILPIALQLVALRCPEAVGRRLVLQEIVGRLEAAATRGDLRPTTRNGVPTILSGSASSAISRSDQIAAARVALDAIVVLQDTGPERVESRPLVVRMPDSDVKLGTVIARGAAQQHASSRSGGSSKAAVADTSVRADDVRLDGTNNWDELDPAAPAEDDEDKGASGRGRNSTAVNDMGGSDIAQALPRLLVARAAAEVHQLGWSIREIEQELRDKSGQFGGSARIAAIDDGASSGAVSSSTRGASSSSSSSSAASKKQGKRASVSDGSFAEDGLGGLVWGDLPYNRMDLAEL